MQPEEQQAMYEAALSHHEQGNLEEAAKGYERLLALHPDGDLLLYNYGLLEYSRGRYERAVELLQRAVIVCPDSVDSWYNLGLALKGNGCLPEAEQAYRKALALDPTDTDVRYNLAGCCTERGKWEEALQLYREVLAQDPEHAPAMNNLAYLYHRQGEYAEAKKLYQRLLQIRPGDTAIEYLLASITGSSKNSPPRQYISDLFDHYADRFEEDLLGVLEYRVPALLQEMVTRHGGRPEGFARMLDLGCGTGLAGEVFRPCTRVLTGVDLSGAMIEQARKKRIYDELVVADLLEYLAATTQRFDLLVAADVLTYLGDLALLFRSVTRVAAAGSLFCFSVEQGDSYPYQVGPTGRFGHHPEYISSLAHENSWQVVAAQTAGLRREAGEWIQGGVYLLAAGT